jgi:parallel beta-helix repeat protein
MKKVLAALCLAKAAHAGVIQVSTPVELTAAIANASAGDEIVLAGGTYLLGNVTCAAVGSASQPIVVRAESPLAAKIEFNGGEGFRVTGAHWHFEDLDVRGVCATDELCEHAFHVMGAAHDFVLRRSRVVDFNAQLKVNASLVANSYVTPNRGLVEYNEVGDTRGRNTDNPVTKLNIDTGEDWIVRGNYLHDPYKMAGDGISYVAFMKSGSKRGLFERNLVLCAKSTAGGIRLGLSFGGGGTDAQFCAPAFDANTPCSVEHDGGTMRNNIIVNCTDVGIYLNRAKDSHILYNTLIATNGVDFRYDTSSGEAVGNLLGSMIRTRDGGTMITGDNRQGITTTQFMEMYRNAFDGDLAVIGDVSPFIGGGIRRSDVLDDYCAAIRPSTSYTIGALEHSLPTCDTTRPPMSTIDPTGDGTSFGGDDRPTSNPPPGDGCCQTRRGPNLFSIVLVALGLRRRRATAEPAGRLRS